MQTIGKQMYEWASELFPICRSITGNGTETTLAYIQNLLPNLVLHKIPTGTKVFDWEVPKEWNIKDAFVANESGEPIISFKENNLHVVGYSTPIDQWMTFKELDQHLYSLPEQPEAIPYATSYYTPRWGFCLKHSQREKLLEMPEKKYHVKIDSTLRPGSLVYGDLIIKGKSEQEILISTYVCHPSMANNELSGPCVATAIAKWIAENFNNLYYTYRFVFIPETIGSIVYLSQNLPTLKKNTVAGFVLSCIGDNRTYSYLASPYGNTLADRVAKHVLDRRVEKYKSYSYLDRGSDERQYCSPGVELPVCSLHRSKYKEYPEYHTSLDDLSLISPEGLEGGFNIVKECIRVLEINRKYKYTTLCEPQLGKRGLYSNLSIKGGESSVKNLFNLLAFTNGENDLITIAELMDVFVLDFEEEIQELIEHELLAPV
jgi:aminopeptidase-like protein